MVKQLTHRQYDALESAVVHGKRVSVYRRGTEYVGVPQRIFSDGPREAVVILHPTTGEEITIHLDDIERLEVVTQ
ncbi:MAG TPA: hypothetical protein VHM24_11955 [Gemmatimonadaceae bacterium]|nr:hypothetical protein [Gemmatimonadaceae bacterium]